MVLQAFEALEFWNIWNTYLVILGCDLSLKEKIDVSPIHSPQVYIVLFLVHLFQLSHPSNGQLVGVDNLWHHVGDQKILYYGI